MPVVIPTQAGLNVGNFPAHIPGKKEDDKLQANNAKINHQEKCILMSIPNILNILVDFIYQALVNFYDL